MRDSGAIQRTGNTPWYKKQKQQQQQVYSMLIVTYKTCARNYRGLFEAGTREKKK